MAADDFIDVEDGLPSFLMNDPVLFDLVADRICPLVIPLNISRPAIAFQRISTPTREMAHDGPVGSATARIQLTAEGRTYAEAKRIMRSLRRRLGGYRGIWSTNDGQVVIQSIQVSNDSDGYSQTAQIPVVRADVFIQYKEV
jgi:hypothetical protein